MSSTPEKKSRVVARVPENVWETIQAAADLEGATLNQFCIQAAYRHAQEILERENLIRLNREQAQWVFDSSDKPKSPNQSLKDARAVHQKLICD